MLKKIALTAWCLLFACKAFALQQRTPHATAELSAADNGDSVTVELRIVPKNGWYIHSRLPGEFGLPAAAEWDLGNYVLAAEEWSDGEDVRYQGFGLNVYKKEGFYRAVLEKGPGKSPALDVSWMACGEECFPEKLHFELQPEAFAGKSLPNPHREKNVQSGMPLWLKAVLLAFAGGIVLNLMPCVLPVLFIKVIGVINERDRRRSIADAWAYLAGVLVCFTATAAVLMLLKTRGEALGWGFQLQSPYFAGGMAAVFFVLALMFLDVVHFNFPLQNLPAGAFLTGLLAVLVASPCTAPFMGAAIGWILTSNVSPYAFYGVFAALGLGYALPFFCAGYFPEVLQKILPRPGRWMLWLKRFFALPMLMTCGWLLWVLSGLETPSSAEWRPYDRAEVERLAKAGEKVFVDFTAKWCLTCLANEKTVLDGERFAALVKERKIRLFKADWTQRSEKITEALAAFGRGSIPLYVYYRGDGGFVLLPQILTYDAVEKALR